MRTFPSGRPALPLVLACGLAAGPAIADPALGIGVSYTFGGGQSETGVGLRVFADDARDQATLTIGADYLIGSGTFRPTVGAAYVGTDLYIGIDAGAPLGRGGLDFGVGVGLINTHGGPAPPPQMDQTPR